MGVANRPIDEGLREAGCLSEAAQGQVTRNIYNLVRRCKKEEFGVFSYICMRCRFTCDGRKQIVQHLEIEHPSAVQKSLQLCKKESFSFLLNKLVMTAPFMKSAVAPSSTQSAVTTSSTQSAVAPSSTQSAVPPSSTQSAIAPSSTQSSVAHSSTKSAVSKDINKCTNAKKIVINAVNIDDNEKSAAKTNDPVKAGSKRKLIIFDKDEVGPKKIQTQERAVSSISGENCIQFDHDIRFAEQRAREEAILAIFSDQELKNILLAYLEILSSIPSLKTFSMEKLISKACTKKDENTVLDLLLLIYEFANGYYHNKDNSQISETSTLRFGKLCMTSGQRNLIKDCGLRCLRCQPGMSLAWRHPDCWRILLPPGSALSSSWGKLEDSQLIIAAYKHNLDVEKVAGDEAFEFKKVAVNVDGNLLKDFKDRYGYMMNLFMFRGKFNEEFGYKAANLKVVTSLQEKVEEEITEPKEEDIEMVELSDDEATEDKEEDVIVKDKDKSVEEQDSLDDLIDEMKAKGELDEDLNSSVDDKLEDKIKEDLEHAEDDSEMAGNESVKDDHKNKVDSTDKETNDDKEVSTNVKDKELSESDGKEATETNTAKEDCLNDAEEIKVGTADDISEESNVDEGSETDFIKEATNELSVKSSSNLNAEESVPEEKGAKTPKRGRGRGRGK